MGKNHMKRLAAPKSWQIRRKGLKFITKHAPGSHNLDTGIPLNVLLKEVLNYAGTTKDAKRILNTNEFKIDGKVRRDFRHSVGLFDAVESTNTNEHFRIILNKKGKIDLIKISKEDASSKPCKIIGKTMTRGKIQLNLYDGKNILVDKDIFKVGDTVVVSLPEHKISKHLKLDKKSSIFLIGGKHTGEIGHVENIIRNKIIYKNQKNDLIETSKKYAFVVEDGKQLTTSG
ncbi:30S ribosomal protein S4e [Candidatus Woesearchaeota archaeon]|nr:30S ribosomal protein S4e [Candidatus Woesearchaeota archaeon]